MTTTTRTARRPSHSRRIGVAVVAAALVAATPVAASGSPAYRRDTTPPDVIPLLSGYSSYWVSDGANDLHGTVVGPRVLSRDDQLVVWVNQHATDRQRFKALQDSVYQNDTKTAFDQSFTVSTGSGPGSAGSTCGVATPAPCR